MRAVKARTGVFMVPVVRQDSWLLGVGSVPCEGCLKKLPSKEQYTPTPDVPEDIFTRSQSQQ